MTDINELAQSLKAAAEKATQGNWRAFQYHDGRCGIGGGHNAEIMVCEHISKERPHDAMFIALASPANVLALVEALEKAQQRIAKLESRTVNVKLPTTIEPTAFSPWVAKAFYQFHKDTVKSCFAVFSDACAAAGIKVEAE
ncbi:MULTISPECIES: ead/Ea22-like family protein [unclassified Klebsiella]|uniref:ead/Ea22-like family protein n=1 Tax=unclassified Klebsiella TaxID=2608929 RepID=UPI0024DE65A7|nr:MULTISPECIES: ead/Ea22-like family protein [unclassified Klebsiella]MDK1845527.1 ead/Ea22-like family protein [Klebsiella sp. K5-1]MDK1942883.1 ead/Ea22-like family protein [Klebsiella sp. K4-32]MDK1970668.1 ead/Ea22-like family protein [Klebsiella sp. K5-45]MDK2002489.1 ead/Ea22-like family protein [Klebsiella sp. K4-44]